MKSYPTLLICLLFMQASVALAQNPSVDHSVYCPVDPVSGTTECDSGAILVAPPSELIEDVPDSGTLADSPLGNSEPDTDTTDDYAAYADTAGGTEFSASGGRSAFSARKDDLAKPNGGSPGGSNRNPTEFFPK